jgi:hypothetical protein
MKELLAKSQEVYSSLVQKEAEATKTLALVREREALVKVREERNSAYESAAEVLLVAERRRQDADTELARVEEERVKFDNWMREERQALKNEEGRLAPLQDAERQLAVDRATLYAREQALEVEKRDYKVRYIAKIKAHFANTGGAPNPDEIT